MCPIATLLESTGQEMSRIATKVLLLLATLNRGSIYLVTVHGCTKLLVTLGNPHGLSQLHARHCTRFFVYLTQSQNPAKTGRWKQDACVVTLLVLMMSFEHRPSCWNSLCWLRQVEEDVTEKRMWQFKSSPFKCIYS